MSMIHYAFGKYAEFVLSTRQILATTPIDQLQYAVNKTVFNRSASLGKVEKSVRRLRARLEKHICPESTLLDTCWEDLTVGEGAGCERRNCL